MEQGARKHRDKPYEKKSIGLRLGMQIQPLAAAGFEEIEGSFPAMVRERMGGLVVQPIFVSEHGRCIADLAARNRRPTISDPGRTKSLGKTKGVKLEASRRKPMNKRTVMLVVAASMLASVHPAEGQKPAKVRKIGFLTATSGPPATSYELLRQGLRELGYVEDQNIVLEYRAAADRSRLSELATELAQLKVEVIVTAGGATGRAQMVAGAVPIVFSVSGDPVEAGFVESLARPGGNMTGITWLAFELVGKRLELLKEAVPKVSRVAVLANPAHPGEQRELKETQSIARALGTILQYHQLKIIADFSTAFDAAINENANAILVFPDPLTFSHRKQIAEFAAKRRIASVFGWKEYVEAGGLMSYGPDREETLKRLAVYVDKILKGAKPTELPVEQPKKFELVINLKTAKQIGLTIPPNVLARADKVIR